MISNSKRQQKQKVRMEELHKKEEEDLMQILAKRHGIPYVDLSTVSINGEALRLIDEQAAREAEVAPFDLVGRRVKMAVRSPNKDGVKRVLDDLKREGYEVTLFIVSEASLEKAWNIYKELSYTTQTRGGVFDISDEELEEYIAKSSDLESVKELIHETISKTKKYKTSRILEAILGSAIAIDASDVHIEIEEGTALLRMRLDGVLHNIMPVETEMYELLLSRIKLLSGLTLNIESSAQDGRFSIRLKETDIEIRTSVLPGEHGESIVMRLLNPETIAISFEELGINESLFGTLQKEIARPNGMILTTGPTGSGKTTTLYAILRKVFTPEIKIITIEDPIEYHMKGITQTQVDESADYTFKNGLRSTLRQDPDVIMIGEIRDADTARIAINAALTGHLVLSTLHTNDAAGVIPRLLDLGANPKTLSSALNISLAQRLVRKLCPDCKVSYTPSEDVKETIGRLLESARKKQPVEEFEYVLWQPPQEETKCETCGGIGYKGRVGVFEGILTDGEVEDVIVSGNPSSREVQKSAEHQNIFTMGEDGAIKALQGITSFEELGRVVDLTK